MKQFLHLLLFILIPFLSSGQDLNGRWSGISVQKIGNKVFTYDVEMLIKQEGNKISGKRAAVQRGTKNYSIVKFSGTVKNGKVKIDTDHVVKIDYPETNFDFLCFRSYKGELSVDENNNLLVIELETYGGDLKYELATKNYSYGSCPPSISRLTKKYKETDNKNLIAEDSIISESNSKKEIIQIGKKEIKLSTKKVKIKVWDKYEEDGDVVNLYLNGKILFPDLEVTKKGEILDIELQSGENSIEVEALNEGRVSPNTSAIRIFVDNQQYDIILSARKGQRDALKIILD